MKLARKGLVSPARVSGGRESALAAPIRIASERHKRPPAPDRSGVTGGGGEFSPRHRRSSDFQAVTEISTTSLQQREHNAMEVQMLRRKHTVKIRPHTVNVLRQGVAAAVSGEPAKVIALKLGVSHRQVENWRSGLLLPQVPTFLEIAKRDPQLRAQVIAILSGEAEAGTPENIAAIMRFMQERERGAT